MNENQYDTAMKEAKTELKNKKKSIIKEYAKSNNYHKVGDMIVDHHGSGIIKIEKIGYCKLFLSDYPECKYYGPLYTRAGKPFKNGKYETFFQHRVSVKLPNKKGK